MIEDIEIPVLLPPAYKPIFQPKRYKLLSGGRGSAKSETVGRYLIIRASTECLRILCTREYQKNISESVYLVLKDIITSHGLHNYEITKSEIKNVATGSHFIFTGLQDIDSIKSMKGINICWCEEAHSLSEHSIEVLTPTIREPNSELIFTFNRQEEEDPIYTKFCKNPMSNVWYIHTTYRDNPFFPEVLKEEMEIDKITDTNLYNHKWEGMPLANKGNIFDLSWFLFTDQLPAEKDYDYRYITCDTAYKEKQESDYTVFPYWGIKDKKLYLIDILRDKKQSVDVEGWSTPWIKPKVTYGFRYVWIEDKGHGIYLNQRFPQIDIPVPPEDVNHEIISRKQDKVERANNAIPWIDKINKNVIINSRIDAKVLNECKQELVFFPNGAHDDFVDAFCDGIKVGLAVKDYVSEMRRTLYG